MDAAAPAPQDRREDDEDAAAPFLPLPRHTEVKVGDGLMLARVERIFRNEGGRRGTKKVLFQARWFLKKEDVDSLPLEELTGPVATAGFAQRITEHDLVLSNQSDDNHVTTICGLIQVL